MGAGRTISKELQLTLRTFTVPTQLFTKAGWNHNACWWNSTGCFSSPCRTGLEKSITVRDRRDTRTWFACWRVVTIRESFGRPIFVLVCFFLGSCHRTKLTDERRTICSVQRAEPPIRPEVIDLAGDDLRACSRGAPRHSSN